MTTTRAGTCYGLMQPPHSAAPTLLLLAGTAEDALTIGPYCRAGTLLHRQGWNVVSLDLPCHGADRRPGEPEGLAGWAARLAAGEDVVADFQRRVNDVLEHLTAAGLADPGRLAAAGTSRGGFMAFHAAAGNPRIRAVAGFAPVTDLLAVSEFRALESNPLANRLALANASEALADRAAWMTIGSQDDRVSTEKAVGFARALSAASQKRLLACDITLRILAAPGHSSFPDWHDDAAVWLRDALAPTVQVLPYKGHLQAVPCTVCPPSPQAGGKPGLVVHLYGSGGSHAFYNLMRPPYGLLRRLLPERGYRVVVPDLGPSHWMNEQAMAALDAIIEGLTAGGQADPTRIHILGTSMGAASGLVYAMRRPAVVRSVCAVFPVTDLAAWAAQFPERGVSLAQAHGVQPGDAQPLFRELSPLNHVPAFANMPVYLLHGDADGVVPARHSRDFAAALRAAGCPVTYREVPGIGHDDSIAASWQEEILEFLTGESTSCQVG
jgi:dipeptidyl aminopeptidase/acylaminoacyl peptidase